MSNENQTRDEFGRFGQSLSNPKPLKPRGAAYLSIEEVALRVELTPKEEKLERFAELIPQMAPIHRPDAAKLLLALVRLKKEKSEE